jgi:hypothetical protein
LKQRRALLGVSRQTLYVYNSELKKR